MATRRSSNAGAVVLRREGRRVLARLLALALLAVPSVSAAFASFSFDLLTPTHDLRRPLIVDLSRFPSKAEDVRAFAALARGLGPEGYGKVYDSLGPTRRAISSFLLNKYGPAENVTNIRLSAKAIHELPSNGFAWTQLGAALALMNQPRAAIAATERSLRLLDGLPIGEPGGLAELRTVSLLNLASFRLGEEEPALTLEALHQLDPEALNPFHRLAAEWSKAQAHADLGESAEARAALARAAAIPPLDSLLKEVGPNIATLKTAYPQYFRLRPASHLYVQGLVSLAEGDAAAAVAALTEAEQQRRGLFEISFSLANALLAAGDPKLAATKLRLLEEAVEKQPSRFFRRERIAFNRGNVYRVLDDPQQAAVAYGRAIVLVEKRAADFKRLLDRELTDDIYPYLDKKRREAIAPVIDPILTDDAAIFSEAYVNRGIAYRELGRLDEAEADLRKALENDTYRTPHVVHANLARLYWQKGQPEAGLAEMAQALAARPDYQEGLAGLHAFASKATDPEDAARASSILIDALSRLGPFDYVEERFGPWLAEMRTRLTSAEEGPEARRALGRLYLLTDEEAAWTFYDQASRDFPEAAWPLVGLSLLGLEKRRTDPEQVAGWVTTAVARQEGSAKEPWADADRRDAYYLQARLLVDRGDLAGARDLFSKALAISPGWGPAASGLSYVASRESPGADHEEPDPDPSRD